MIDISFGNQWTQFTNKTVKWNWIIFNLINIEIENETYLGTFYIEICLVGFYVRISWLYNEDTPARNKLKKYLNETTKPTHKRNTKKNV